MTAIFRSPWFLETGAWMLNVGSQRILHRPTRFKGSQDDVGSYRRAPEDLITQCIRERVQNRGAPSAHGWFADAARSYGRLRVWNFHGPPGHLVRNIQNCRRLGMVEPPGNGHAVLLVVHPFLADGVANTKCRSS